MAAYKLPSAETCLEILRKIKTHVRRNASTLGGVLSERQIEQLENIIKEGVGDNPRPSDGANSSACLALSDLMDGRRKKIFKDYSLGPDEKEVADFLHKNEPISEKELLKM